GLKSSCNKILIVLQPRGPTKRSVGERPFPLPFARSLRVFASLKARFAGVALAATFGIASAQAADITGAGATFIYPILAKWSDSYHKATGNKVNYQSIGSGG